MLLPALSDDQGEEAPRLRPLPRRDPLPAGGGGHPRSPGLGPARPSRPHRWGREEGGSGGCCCGGGGPLVPNGAARPHLRHVRDGRGMGQGQGHRGIHQAHPPGDQRGGGVRVLPRRSRRRGRSDLRPRGRRHARPPPRRGKSAPAPGRSSGGGGGIHFGGGGGGGGGGGLAASASAADKGGDGPGGVLVLAATSGPGRRTRLHTCRSPQGTAAGSAGSGSAAHPPSGPPLAFAAAFSQAAGAQTSFVELPGSVPYADLRVCGDGFSVRTETGLYYGTMDPAALAAPGAGGALPTGGTVDAGLLPYDGPGMVVDGPLPPPPPPVPVSTALTPHHFILLGEGNELRFVDRVARRVVQRERVDWAAMAQASGGDGAGAGPSFPAFGGGSAELIMDSRRPDQVWLRRARSLVHISSSNEARDVWMYTLQQCLDQGSDAGTTHRDTALLGADRNQDVLFERAVSLCSSNAQKDVVMAARAEFHLTQGRVELAAKYMAQVKASLRSFERTSVHLALPALGVSIPMDRSLSSEARDALSSSNMGLLTYLSDRLRLSKAKGDDVACAMIGAWLTELHLNERTRAGLAGSPAKKQRARGASGSNALLHQFLSSNADIVDARTTVSVLSSHDVHAVECAGYAAAAADVGTAINASLHAYPGKDGALDTIRVLGDAPFEQAEPFFYKHAFALLARAPMAAAKCFLAKYSEGLSPSKLLPSFMHYERRRKQMKNEGNMVITESVSDSSVQIEGKLSYDGVELRIDTPSREAFLDDESPTVKYLEGAIKLGCKSTSVFNYLIILFSDMEDEVPLHRFLSTHLPNRPSKTYKASPLDMPYALRVVLKTGRHFRSAVKLYMAFGMRQQAVELAIKVDPDMAREIARESITAEEQKRLWLMIARNAAAGGMIDGKDVVVNVASVLNDCGPDVLSIEDVLPFLPNFAQIDRIQDDICSALTSYSSKIERLMKEMNECEHNCEDLREEITNLNASSMTMRSDARCAITNKALMFDNESFYVFPSGYVYLESALMEEVKPYLNSKQSARLERVVADMEKIRKVPVMSEDDEIRLQMLQSELDGLIAAECPLTGRIIVDSIDKGFGDDGL